MATDVWYTIKKNRIDRACMTGFLYNEASNRLVTAKDTAEHVLYLKALDGADEDSTWGRLSFEMDIHEDAVCYVYAAASNYRDLVTAGRAVILDELFTDPEASFQTKMEAIRQLGGKRFVNTDDILLYDLKGRYLYLAFEVLGGEGSLSNIRVSSRGDNFLSTFPAVYQERGSFFHRYLSIFSSIYNDVREDVQNCHEVLDLATCPAEYLETYARWFGIDLKGGFLSESILRTIVQEAYQLNRMKGTRKCLERLLEIILGEQVILMEHGAVNAYEKQKRSGFEAWEHTGPFDVTILVTTPLSEELRHQLIFILDQFKPLRTKLHILQMERGAVLDANTYLDINASLPEEKGAILDEGAKLGQAVLMD